MSPVRAALVVATLLAGACAYAPRELSNTDIEEMLENFDRQTDQLRLQREAVRQLGIHRVEVSNPGAPLVDQRVSVSLENARLESVIKRLQINYTLDGISKLSGRVTAEFENLPMTDALAAILLPSQLQATFGQQLVIISRLPEVALSLDSQDDYVMHKRVMRYADTRALEPLLYALLGDDSGDDSDDDDDSDDESDDDSGSASPTKSLSFTAIHAENAILLKGPSADVGNAMQILQAIDTDTGHIMIEATVLEFSVTDLLQIGTRISNGASGTFSDVSIDWASMIGETLAFTTVSGASNTRAFSAAISLLLQTDQARVVARPYMAAIPGYQATLDVAEDRYVTTFTDNAGDITLEPVTSGIKMNFVPFLLPDEQIRMDMEVSVSQFVPTLDNVSLARSRSDASSTVRIGSGETLVIGGLMAQESASSHAGVPGARSVPGFGFLFGERKQTHSDRRVLVFITPYIWEPGTDTPVGATESISEFMREQTQFDPDQ